MIEVGEEKNGGNATQEIRHFSNGRPPVPYGEAEGVLLKKNRSCQQVKYVSVFKRQQGSGQRWAFVVSIRGKPLHATMRRPRARTAVQPSFQVRPQERGSRFPCNIAFGDLTDQPFHALPGGVDAMQDPARK
jgi:hypothetical protein